MTNKVVKWMISILADKYPSEFDSIACEAGFGYCDNCEERIGEPCWGFC
jgi:hypothetical protein